jgi:hypothetical protein
MIETPIKLQKVTFTYENSVKITKSMMFRSFDSFIKIDATGTTSKYSFNGA